jgi:acyl-CoA dehydrogenase
MDFDDTPEEAEFRAEARAFLDAHVPHLAPGEVPADLFERDDPDLIKKAQEWQACKKDNGWAVLTWPEEYGGRGLRAIHSVIWNQEEGHYRTPINVFGIGLGMLGPTIMTHGTDEQKKKYLARMARGDDIWCQLFSEPAAGSDLASLRMKAERDGDDWILSGQKIWTTGAHYSRYGMVVTRSDASVVKHAGLTYFMVDMKAPGVEIRPIKQISGTSAFSEVFFTDVRIPDSYRVGAVGNGWRVAITTLMNERSVTGGAGRSLRAEDVLRLAQEVDTETGKAIDDAGVRHRIADFYVRANGLKYTTYRTLTALSRGQTPGPESSIFKLVMAPLNQEIASFGMELQGQAGSLMDESYGCQLAYLATPGLRIAAGTDEILRNIVAERVLQLPGEPRVDKGIPFKDIPAGAPSK